MDFYENDNVVRILTIVDNALVNSTAFDNAGMNVKFVCVPSVLDAMKQLKTWAEQGKSADIVDVQKSPLLRPMRDISSEESSQCIAFKEKYCIEDCTEVEVISFLDDWSKHQEEDLQIGKFFINSHYPDELSEKEISQQLELPVSVHHVMEYDAMLQHAKYGYEAQKLGVNDYTLRKYLNSEFKANYYLHDDDCYHSPDNLPVPEV